MKTSLTIALALACFSCAPSFAADTAAGGDPLKDELVALERQSWEAWKDHDGKFFDGFLSDDHVDVGAGGVSDKKTIVAGVAGGGCTVKSYAVDHFAFARLGPDTALLTYHAMQDTLCGKFQVPSPAWVSSVFVRRDGHWFNAAFQQTPTPK
ncbi:MAG TPA: nuclear transport factor 2 family protein [Xanthomonadaceae bacterium]